MIARPDVSVVIPVFNRPRLLPGAIRSVMRASDGLDIEIVVIDDGSDVPVVESLPEDCRGPTSVFRQENRGLLFARLAGLDRARGRTVMFLDSDDRITPAKLRLQLDAIGAADVACCDAASCRLTADGDALETILQPARPHHTDPAEFFLLNQPAPHGPLFEASYLRAVVREATFPPSIAYNCVAETWIYFNACIRPARIAWVDGAHALVGLHGDDRLTGKWENLAIASLAVQEAFAASCPRTPQTRQARRIAGEIAFCAWRGLPTGFPAAFLDRNVAVWRSLGAPLGKRCGGNVFRSLARVVGPLAAGGVLRRIQRPRWDAIRTVGRADVDRMLASLPPPK